MACSVYHVCAAADEGYFMPALIHIILDFDSTLARVETLKLAMDLVHGAADIREHIKNDRRDHDRSSGLPPCVDRTFE